MSSFTLNITDPIRLVLLVPTYKNISGVNKPIYPTIEESLKAKDEKGNSINLFFGSFKTYGGTERDVNGVYSIEDTANIETWYRPDIKANCRIAREDGATYDVIADPENINMRNQFLKFKVRRVKGGA